MSTRLAFIGGTGVYDPGILQNIEAHTIETPYGIASYESGYFKDREIIFLARHGVRHTIPPHKINYRANIYALKLLNVGAVVSTTAVGSLNENYKPGDLVLVDQFIDLTKSRTGTFYDGDRYSVAHLDMTHPYCETLRHAILAAGKEARVVIHPTGTYICTEGPRFETPAEISAFRQWGADVVGMTNVPECQLAREAEICYATISMVTNFAAGISPTELTHQEVLDCMNKNKESFRKIIAILSATYDTEVDCACHHAAEAFGGFHV